MFSVQKFAVTYTEIKCSYQLQFVNFNISENSAPGNEIKPSGFQEYLERTNQQTWSSLEDSMAPIVTKSCSNHLYTGIAEQEPSPGYPPNVRYDFPYEPEKFDLSEADFGASACLDDSGYKGSLDYGNLASQSAVNSAKPTENGVNNGVNSVPEPGTPYENVKPGFPNYHCQEPQGLGTDTGNYSQNNGLASEKFPVEAELSPNAGRSAFTFQHNGFSTNSEKIPNGIEKETPVYQTQLSSIPSQTSINSASSDPDKYPVQCNTPQTPKENPLLNPLEYQLGLSTESTNSDIRADNEVKSINSSQKQNGESFMQHDIPKLENLKHDLEQSSVLTGSSNVQVSGLQESVKSYTQSLPASFHNVVIQNGTGFSNSLPMDLSNTPDIVQSKNSNNVLTDSPKLPENFSQNTDPVGTQTVESVNLDHRISSGFDTTSQTHKGTDSETVTKFEESGDNLHGISHTQNLDVTSSQDSKPDDQVNFAGTKDLKTESVVGFGNMEEDIHVDESDLNAYLGDCSDIVATKELEKSEQLVPNSQSKVLEPGILQKRDCDYTESYNNTSINVVPKVENIVIPKVENTGHNTGDHLCNIQNPKDVSLSDMNKLDPGLNLQINSQQVVNIVENPDLEVMKVLSETTVQNTEVTNSEPVMRDLSSATSPNGTMSIDSGCASMQDNAEGSSNASVTDTHNNGARPKDVNNTPVFRSGNMGLSSVDVSSQSPFVAKPPASPTNEQTGENLGNTGHSENVEKVLNDNVASESRQLSDVKASDLDQVGVPIVTGAAINMHSDSNVNTAPVDSMNPEGGDDSELTGHPNSLSPTETGQAVQKQRRPNSLNLPPPPTIDPTDRAGMEEEGGDYVAMDTEATEGQESQAVFTGIEI